MSSLRLTAPPAHTWQLLTWDPTSGDDLRDIRTGLHQFVEAGQAAGGRDGPDDVADRMAMVATELAGNALRHGLPPVVVRLLRDADRYIIDVSDHSPDHAPHLPAPHQLVRAGGRGLFIARSLAQQLCWYQNECTKHVWASFPAPPARPQIPAGH